jgi:hypothetical protein
MNDNFEQLLDEMKSRRMEELMSDCEDGDQKADKIGRVLIAMCCVRKLMAEDKFIEQRLLGYFRFIFNQILK